MIRDESNIEQMPDGRFEGAQGVQWRRFRH
jgi:hypothetical protein